MDFLNELGINLNLERSYNTYLSNSSLLPLLLLSLARQKNSPDTRNSFKDEYDFIIVGAGNAGSTVAARLSEDPGVSVLLLEAGGSPPIISDLPAVGDNQLWFSDIDWKFQTVPQRHTGLGLIDRKIFWPLGKGLGGSSTMNNGVHVRGNRYNYDEWEAMGAKGWSYEDVLPYFIKMEGNTDPEYLMNGYHNSHGPVTVSKPRYEGPFKIPIFDAALSMGYSIVDPNAQSQSGFYDLQGNYRVSQRCSIAKAYLVPAEKRTNLVILKHAFVEKVVIEDNRATGVIFSFQSRNFEVRAKREVILSAGAVNTPKLLMLSGIGPRAELEKFNIPVHADLPVGRNLQDHAAVSVEYLLDRSIALFSEKVRDPRNIMQYISSRTGVLASPSGVSAISFIYNDEVNPAEDYPNNQLFFYEGSADLPKLYWNLKPEVYDQVFKPYENQPLLICFVQQLRPRSRGTVSLQSANPYDDPQIDPNYLDDPKDVNDIVQGMKTCNRILSNPYLTELGARPLGTLYPGCEQFAHDEDQYFRCQAQTVALTFHHPCGTARMGDLSDNTTVVDPKLRVKGITGLRVVDNSIMPTVIWGNTGVPAVMIGEKAADIIKESIYFNDL